MSTVAAGHSIDHAIYGYEALIGLGCGLILSSMTMMVNLITTTGDNGKSDKAAFSMRIGS